MKHTSGEWIISDEKLILPTFDKENLKVPTGVSEHSVKMIKPAEHYAVAFVFNHEGKAEADAKLIAAAPELLEALKMTLTVATQYGIHADHPEFIKARTVINKATK